MLNKNVIEQRSGKNWTVYHGDCVEICSGLPDNSIDFCLHSPPFSNLYIYSDSISDMGNCSNDEEFFEQYSFLIEQLHRITTPGRLCAVHCKDLPLYRNRDGAAGLKDFPGDIIRAFIAKGWTYHSRVTIWKDPVIEMQRTKNHGLLYKNFKVRGEVCRQGMADFLVVFRKWDGVDGTESTKPVIHNPEDFNLDIWQRYASPVWFDIDQTNVLNYQQARSGDDCKHICPLQLDICDRTIDLWTNPGDVVLDPFSGLASTGYSAVKKGRKYIGCELKPEYFQFGCKYLEEAEFSAGQSTLFDSLPEEYIETFA